MASLLDTLNTIRGRKSLPAPLLPNDAPIAKRASKVVGLDDFIRGGDGQNYELMQVFDPQTYRAKSLPFSQYVQDFINDTGGTANPYAVQQLVSAYFSSAYMFAAINRVRNLASRAKIVAQVEQDNGRWEDVGDDVLINRIFEQEGADILSTLYANYAVFGTGVVYKTRTRKAILENQRGEPIYDYKDGAVAGLHTLDGTEWTLDEDLINGGIKGLHIQATGRWLSDVNYLPRKSFVHLTSWNPNNRNEGRALATVAIHEAVTNAAIAQWSSDYFTRGALPLILVTMAQSSSGPTSMDDSDLLRYKRLIEERWQGSDASLRALFMDKQVDVTQVGIEADKVAAPELNETALKGIASVIGIDRELIVAPEGGTQARHEELVMRAWNDTVTPWLEQVVAAFNRDLGFPQGMRLRLELGHIAELEADRKDRSASEVSIFQAGIQSVNETRKKLRQDPIQELDGWFWTGQQMMSLKRMVREDELVSDKLFQQATAAWDSNLFTRGETLELLGRKLPQSAADGYKFEVVKEPGMDGGGFGGGQPTLPAGDMPEMAQEGTDDGDFNAIDALYDDDESWDDGGAFASIDDDEWVDAEFEDDWDSDDLPLDDDPDSKNVSPDVLEPPINATSGFVPTAPVESAVPAPEAYVSLRLTIALNPDVESLVGALSIQYADQSRVRLQPLNSLHITLAYVREINEAALAAVYALLPASIPALTLTVRDWLLFDAFNEPGMQALCLKVEPDERLRQLQNTVYAAFRAHNIEVSDYNDPAKWQPHVTLAYIPQGTTLPTVAPKLALMPDLLQVQRDHYEPVFEVPASVPAPQDATMPTESIETVEARQTRLRHEFAAQLQQMTCWQDVADSSLLPESLKRHLEAAIESTSWEIAAPAAAQAARDGWFDEHSDSESEGDNPVMRYVVMPKATQESVDGELEAWEKVALRSRTKSITRFEATQTPPDIQDQVRGELALVDEGDTQGVKAVFARARKAIEDLAPSGTNEDMLQRWADRIAESGDPELQKLLTLEGGDDEGKDAGAQDANPEADQP